MKIKNEKGATIITVAFLLPILILIAGAVIDIGGAMILKEDLYKACLVSAEESAKTIDIVKAQEEGVNNLTADFSETLQEFFDKNIQEKGNFQIQSLDYEIFENFKNPKYIEVSSEASYETIFLKIFNIKEIKVHASAIGRLKKIN